MGVTITGKALNIIEAKKITEKSIKRAIDEYKAGL